MFVSAGPILVFQSLLSPFVIAAEDVSAMIRQTEQIFRAKSSYAEMSMTIKDPNFERTLKLVAWSEGEEKTLIRILSPRKDKGVSTLRVGREMWNYFPKINKVMKVPPSMMTGSWMGSDFTNDDLVKQTSLAEEYSIALKKTPTEWHFTLVPKKNTATVWGKILIVTDPKLLPLRYDFFNERAEKVRQMKFSNAQKIAGRMVPMKLVMTNLAKPGKSTSIQYLSLKFDHKTPKNFYTLRTLKSKTR